MFSTLRAIMNTILGRVPRKPDKLDTATRMAMDADFTAKPKAEPKVNATFGRAAGRTRNLPGSRTRSVCACQGL